MCGDSWWEGGLSDKGQCKGLFHASTDSKPNVHVQDDSLKWKLLGQFLPTCNIIGQFLATCKI